MKRKQPISLYNTDAASGNVDKGIILIPDISGYTRLVQNTDVITGRSITYELLSGIIQQNKLGLSISEIEGDAILFYKYGDPPPVHKILEQYESMLFAFHSKVEEINERFGQKVDISLKMVAHYGSIAEYTIGGFTKLYGETVITAHRLLKNSVPGHAYALITDDLMDACDSAAPAPALPPLLKASKLYEVYGELRNICYTWFNYEKDPDVVIAT